MSLQSRTLGHATTPVSTRAVMGVHRAGAILNLHVHFHVLCLDGVYVETEANDGTRRFEAAPAPSTGTPASMSPPTMVSLRVSLIVTTCSAPS